MSHDNYATDFGGITYEAWLDRVAVELGKVRADESLSWSIGSRRYDPFAKEMHRPHGVSYRWQQPNRWAMVLEIADGRHVNDWQALLAGGMDEIRLCRSAQVPQDALTTALDQTGALISRQVEPQETTALQTEAYRWLPLCGFDENDWQAGCAGGCSFLLQSTGEANIIDLCLLLHQCLLQEKDPKSFSSRPYRLQLDVGPRFLGQIVRLRALKLVASNLCMAFKVPQEGLPVVEARVGWRSDLDPYTALIDQVVCSHAAVVAGVDALCIEVADCPGEVDMAVLQRNIHHILYHEARLGQALDPLGGSMALEHATVDLSQEVWSELQRGRGQSGAS